jgi:hypothetical protein
MEIDFINLITEGTDEMQPDQNPYEFILDPNRSQRSGPSFLQNPKQRNLIAVAFVAIVIILIIIVGSFLFGGGNEQAQGLQSIALQQNELIRLSNEGKAEAKDSSVRARSATLAAFMQTDYSDTTSYLTSNGAGITKEQVARNVDTDADEQLALAAQRNQYDDVYSELIAAKLATYKADVETAYQNAGGPNAKKLLEQVFDNVTVFSGE